MLLQKEVGKQQFWKLTSLFFFFNHLHFLQRQFPSKKQFFDAWKSHILCVYQGKNSTWRIGTRVANSIYPKSIRRYKISKGKPEKTKRERKICSC